MAATGVWMMPDVAAVVAGAGLCATCRHALVRPTAKGTVYLRCGLAASDARLPKYPRLPVVRCIGYACSDGDEDDARGSDR